MSEQLQQRIAALEAEIESECQLHLSTVRRYEAENAAIRQQLLVAQAELDIALDSMDCGWTAAAIARDEVNRLRGKLCSILICHPNAVRTLAEEALSTPSDTSAIDALVKFVASQESLPPDMQKILHDNAWDLYKTPQP